MESSFRLFPEQGSSAAQQVDALYFFLLGVGAFFTLLICVLIVSFAFYFRRSARRGRRAAGGTHLWPLEAAWLGIPLALTMIMFVWGARLYFDGQTPPVDALEIQVIGKQWMWKIYHPGGRNEINELHMPVGRPVRLRMISEDVIHSFYVPAFRVKHDVLPQRYSSLWFTAARPGTHYLFCAEYCGTDHADMSGRVVAIPPAEYAAWLAGTAAEAPASAGERLYVKARCHECHDRGDEDRCPSLDDVDGRLAALASGETVERDAEYLRESILDPAAKILAGYEPVMPTYRGQLSEEQVLQLVAYLQTRRGDRMESAGP